MNKQQLLAGVMAATSVVSTVSSAGAVVIPDEKQKQTATSTMSDVTSLDTKENNNSDKQLDKNTTVIDNNAHEDTDSTNSKLISNNDIDAVQKIENTQKVNTIKNTNDYDAYSIDNKEDLEVNDVESTTSASVTIPQNICINENIHPTINNVNDISKMQYAWYLDDEVVSNKQDIDITEDMLDKKLKCIVTSEDNKLESNIVKIQDNSSDIEITTSSSVTLDENVNEIQPMAMAMAMSSSPISLYNAAYISPTKVNWYEWNDSNIQHSLVDTKMTGCTVNGTVFDKYQVDKSSSSSTYSSYYTMDIPYQKGSKIEFIFTPASNDIESQFGFEYSDGVNSYSVGNMPKNKSVKLVFSVDSNITIVTRGHSTGISAHNRRETYTYNIIPMNENVEDKLNDDFNKVKANISDIPHQNGLNQNQILNYLKSGISSDSTVSISSYNYKAATSNNSGFYSGVINVTCGGNTKTINLNVVIPQLAQSVTSVYNSFNKILPNMAITNGTTKESIINSVTVTNPHISVTMPVFTLNKSSDSKEGRFVGTILISDSSTGESKSISIDKKIDKVAQTADTAKNNIAQVLKSIQVGNATTESELLGTLKSCIDTSAVTVGFAENEGFTLNGATETEKGSITGKLKISDTYGQTVYLPINLSIDYLKQSVDTVAKLYEKQISNFVATNDTSADDILSSVAIQNPDINVKFNEFNLTPATDQVQGSLTGNIEISLGNDKKVVPVNLSIDYLPMELATAVQLTQSEISKIVPSNEFNFYDFQSNLDDLIRNSNIHVAYSITNSPKLTEATETEKGSITGTVILRQDDFNVEVPMDLVIPQLPQTVDGVVKEIKEHVLPDLVVDNDTEKDYVLDKFKEAITGADGSVINIDIDNWQKIKATEDSTGSITGNAIISDNMGNTEILPFEFEIKQLDRTLTGVVSKLNAFIKDYEATNDTTYDILLSEAKDLITTTGNDDSNIEITLDQEGEDIKATQFAPGKISGTFGVTDGTSKVDVNFNFKRNKLPQTAVSVADYLTAYLKEVKATNDTTPGDILDAVITNGEGLNDGITIAFGTGENENFNKVLATEDGMGEITGTIYVADGTDTIKIPVNLEIAQLNRTISGVVSKLNAFIKDYEATNDTTYDILLSEAKDLITTTGNDDSNIEITLDQEGEDIKATQFAPGKISGTFGVTDGTSKVDVNFNFKRNKLPQTAVSVADYLTAYLKEVKATNDTTPGDILDAVITNGEGLNDGITIAFGTGENENFNKVLATEDSAGKITGTIYVSDEISKIDIPVNLDIEKLARTVEGAKSNIEAALKSFKATNNTTEKDVIDHVSTNISKDNLTIAFGNNEKDKFNLEKATTKNVGKITGIIYVSDGKTTANISVNLPIDILSSEQDIKNAIKDVLDKFKPSNNTKKEDIENKIKEVLPEDKKVSIDNFEKEKSTSKNTGKITGDIHVTGGIDMSLDMKIDKLQSSSSSRHHHSSSSSDDDKTEVIEMNGENNGDTFNQDTNWELINGKWKHKNVNGYYDIGWVKINDYWYYFDIEGDMVTGWLNYKGSWYYLSEEESTIGIMQTGWALVGGNWYYLSEQEQTIGIMQIGWVLVNGSWYHLNSSGAMNVGWYQDYDGNWYYLNNSGAMATGWVLVNGNWYYLNSSGAMVTGWISVNGSWYHLNSSGAMNVGWYQDYDGNWYYLNSSGAMATGWLFDNGNWYYLYSSGAMATGWLCDNGNWYYLNNSGAMAIDWIKINGSWYYFNSQGQMQSDCLVDGYKLSYNGAMIG